VLHTAPLAQLELRERGESPWRILGAQHRRNPQRLGPAPPRPGGFGAPTTHGGWSPTMWSRQARALSRRTLWSP